MQSTHIVLNTGATRHVMVRQTDCFEPRESDAISLSAARARTGHIGAACLNALTTVSEGATVPW